MDKAMSGKLGNTLAGKQYQKSRKGKRQVDSSINQRFVSIFDYVDSLCFQDVCCELGGNFPSKILQKIPPNSSLKIIDKLAQHNKHSRQMQRANFVCYCYDCSMQYSSRQNISEALKVPTRGALGNWITVTKAVSPEAKSIFGWCVWLYPIKHVFVGFRRQRQLWQLTVIQFPSCIANANTYMYTTR